MVFPEGRDPIIPCAAHSPPRNGGGAPEHGKKNAVSIYESLDVYTEARFPYMEQVLAAYNSGLTSYRSQDFKVAATQFEKALNLHPSDSLSKLYRERCTHFLTTPPPEDWDGVWTMTTK